MRKAYIISALLILVFSLFAQEPLFDVKNDSGISIFSVYPDGVKILGMKLNATSTDLQIKNDAGTELLRLDAGGMNLYDAEGQRLLAADADSIRFYLYEDPDPTDEGRGGFAIATVGSTSDDNGDKFFDLTPENYFIGHESGKVNTEGTFNSFMGYQTGISNTVGDKNLFFGYQSGHSNIDGRLNSFFGYKAGFSNIGGVGDNDGDYNAFFGNEAGIANQSGYHNTFIGHLSGHENVNGYSNTFIGSSTGYYSTGIRNTYIGSGSNVMGSDGSYNTYVGSWSGQMNNGSDNVLIGFRSGQMSNNGYKNTFLGSSTGYNNEGHGNVLLGFRAGYSESGSDKLYIANGASADSTLIYGEFDTQYVGIADNNPSKRLSLGGTGSANGISLGDDQSTAVSLYHYVDDGVYSLRITNRIHFGTAEYMEDGGSNETSFGSDIRPAIDNYYDLGTPSYRWDDVYATNGTIVTSDERDKENIEPIQYGLTELLQMNPVSFNWKGKSTTDTKLGLIAQELLEVVPEVVKTHDEKIIDEASGEKQTVELERYGVYYSDLIPILIKSIQDQQKEISELKEEINKLKK